MKYYKYIIYIFVFAFCLNVKAEGTCTTDEMNRLKELANNVEIVKNIEVDDIYYNEEEKNFEDIYVYYTIKITNLDEDLIVFFNDNGNRKIVDRNKISELLFDSDSVVTFYIYSYTNSSCTNKPLKTITVKFDKYNLYYYLNKERCSKYPDFKYCKEYMNIGNNSYEKIDKLFDEYVNVKEKNLADNNYTYYIVGGVIAVILIIIITSTIIHKYKKNKL